MTVNPRLEEVKAAVLGKKLSESTILIRSEWELFIQVYVVWWVPVVKVRDG